MAFAGCTSLTHIICNNPDRFIRGQSFPTADAWDNADLNTSIFIENTEHLNQMQFISSTDYLKQNHQGFLEAIKPLGIFADDLSYQELNLIMKLDASKKESVIHRGLQSYTEALLEFEFDEDTIDADFIHNIKIIFSANSYIEAKTLLPNDAYDMLIHSFHTSNVPMSTGITLLNDASERLGIEVTPNILKNHLKNYIYQLIDNHPNKDTLLFGATNAQTLIEEHHVNTSFDWKTIATSFKDRSMDQIKAILDYFGKTHCMPNTENSISFEQQDKIPAVVEGISMFLNPIEYTNLSMTAKEVILISQEHEELDQEDDSTSFCSIQ
jgi:hypothetical protein